MPSQKAQKTSRSSSAPAPEPTYELYDVAEGDRVEIYYHKKDTYYGAEVLQVHEDEDEDGEAAWLRVKYDGAGKKSKGVWIKADDPKTRYETISSNWEKHITEAWGSDVGHVREDMFERVRACAPRALRALRQFSLSISSTTYRS